MGSPLNPKARKIGKRITKIDAKLGEWDSNLAERALQVAKDNEGYAVVNFNGVNITVKDTDKIESVIKNLRKSMGTEGE